VILLLLYLFKKEKKLDFKKYDFKFNFPILKKMIGLSSKVFVGEGIWVLGSFFYTYCCIQKGTSDLLMQQIIFGVEEIFIMASFGLTSCGMIMISHEIGKGQIKSMKEHAKLILKSGRIISIVSGFLLIIFSAFFIQYVYDNIDVEIIKNIKFVLYFNAIFMSIKVCSFILGNGILKGGGDLTSVMLYDILAMSFGIITAFMLSIIFNYGFYGAFIGKVLEEILRFILMYSRYKSEKYYKSIV
jgi:Na+-driven multidrug efflux pump